MQHAQTSISDDLRNFIRTHSKEYIVYNLNHEFVCDNAAHRRTVGLSDQYQLEGRHISEPPAPCYQTCAPDFIEFLEQTVKKGKTKTLDVHYRGQGDWFCYTCENTLMQDGQGRDAYIIHHGQPVFEAWQDSMKSLLSMQHHYTGQRQVSMQVDTVRELTQHQAEVLFFLLGRVEPKRIGRYLNMTESAVNKTVDRMRFLLGCGSTSQLIEKVVGMDWHKLIPQRLLGDKQIAMILD